MNKAIYDDGTYIVTSAVISTPTRVYPISNATARIRNDAGWLALAASILTGSSIALYGDLLTPTEAMVAVSLCLCLIAAGSVIRVLTIDAIGHRRIFIVGTAGKIGRLFRAVRSAAGQGAVLLESDT